MTNSDIIKISGFDFSKISYYYYEVMIIKEEIAKLESILRAEKKRVEKGVNELGGAELGSDVDHGEEESDEMEKIVTDEGITYSLKERLNDINLALDKIGTGAYGVCEDCDKEISLDLLKINPESRLCKECKKKQEEKE